MPNKLVYIAALLIVVRPGFVRGQTLKWDENQIFSKKNVLVTDRLLLTGTANWTNADNDVGRIILIKEKSAGKTEFETSCSVPLDNCKVSNEDCYCKLVEENIFSIILNKTITRGDNEMEFYLLATHENGKDHVESKPIKPYQSVSDPASTEHESKPDPASSKDENKNDFELLRNQVQTLRNVVCTFATILLVTFIASIGIFMKMRLDIRELQRKLDNLGTEKTKAYHDEPMKPKTSDPQEDVQQENRDRKTSHVKYMRQQEQLDDNITVRLANTESESD